MNLRGQVAWEVLPGEDSEEPRHVNFGMRWFTSHETFNCQVIAIWVSLDGFHIIGSSTVGYSEYSGYVSSGYSFSGWFLNNIVGPQKDRFKSVATG